MVKMHFYTFLLSAMVICLSNLGEVEGRVPPAVRVGSVFLEREQEVHESFRLGIETLRSRQLLNQTEIQFDIQYAEPDDYFHLYTRACIEVGYGIVTFFGPSNPGLDKQLESISTSLGIPLISTAPRTLAKPGRGSFQSAFSPENLVAKSELTLALHPTQDHLVSLITDLTKELSWKDVSIIHDPMHGIIEPTVLAESLQVLSGSVSVHQISTDLRATLVQLRLKGARNIIIDTSVTELDRVIQAALDTGMMSKNYCWIFTMLDMEAGNWTRLGYSEALILGLNMIDRVKFKDFQDRFGPSVSGSADSKSLPETTKVALTLDAVELLARGLEEFDNSGTDLSTPSSTSCTGDKKWDVGEELRDVFSSVSFDGVSGPISFANGARSRIQVKILKLAFEDSKKRGIFTPKFLAVGNWSEGISYEVDGLRMEGNLYLTSEKPSINKTLVITTTDSSSCFSRRENGQDEGFCVDLAHHLAKIVGFQFKFKLVSDGRYGRPDPLNGQWDGMIGEVIRGEADIALADLTVTAARQSVVDFTTPFMQTSLAALFKVKEDTLDGLSTLLSPFSIWVWVSIALAFFITSICLRLVAWMSPYQKDDIILPGSDGSPSLGHDLSWINSMWVLSSTIVLRGCDIRLQAASSRTLAVVWWVFSLVIIILYASLVSHWFDKRATTLSSYQTLSDLLEDPLFDFGLIQSGSTNQFLQTAKREDLQKVWWRVQKGIDQRSMQSTSFDGIAEVKRSINYAFVTEAINFNQALVEDCSLGVVNGIDDRNFALAVSKGSPLREKLSQGILSLGESGVLRQLEEKWWPRSYCRHANQGVHSQAQVKLVHFAGPLCVLVVGILVSIFIAMIERLFYHRRSHRGFFRTATESGNGKIPMNGSNCDAESEN